MKPPELIAEWGIGVSRMKGFHYEAATVLEHMHRRLGVPAIVLSTIVGASVFTALARSPAAWIQVLVGLMSLAAALLSSLQTYQKYAERAERHRIAGARYGSLKSEI